MLPFGQRSLLRCAGLAKLPPGARSRESLTLSSLELALPYA